jgi:hypothetical protein
MRLIIGFKTPDAIHYALEDATNDEGEALTDEEREEAEEKLRKWIQYGECVTVEFDLAKMKAKVVER